jgi:hypothetical protein
VAWAREGAVLKGFDWNKIVAKNEADGLSRCQSRGFVRWSSCESERSLALGASCACVVEGPLSCRARRFNAPSGL